MTVYKDRVYAFADSVSHERGLDDWEISDDHDDYEDSDWWDDTYDCGCCMCCGCTCYDDAFDDDDMHEGE